VTVRRAVFLDRDGVLNERAQEHDYVRSAAQFRWLPGAAEAVGRLCRAGFVTVVVSNQRGVARGLMPEQTLYEIEAIMQRDLAAVGGRIDAFYYCLHDLDEQCDCRKPRPGLLLRGADELGLDLTRSIVIGDSLSDVEAGRAAGCSTILVGDGPAEDVASGWAADLADAVSELFDRDGST